MELRTCSKARPAANIAKVDAKGTSPIAAAPAATASMLPSAMPQLKWRSGKAFLNTEVLVAPERSASKTMTSSCSLPSSASALP